MDDIIMTDSAMHSTSDISGVKDTQTTIPESGVESGFPVAEGEKNTEISDTCAKKCENDSQADSLEAEFDALIHGRFSEVYKKRTENIIRRRLRSGKARPEGVEAPSENKDAPITQKEEDVDAKIKEKEAQNFTDGYEKARQINQNRPIENGLGSGGAVITKINVSALDGQGVLSIIKRVGSGEKISFK